MSVLLDELKAKIAFAQKRLQEATAKLQAAQQEHHAANQEVGSLTFLITTYAQREQAERASVEAAQKNLALEVSPQVVVDPPESRTEPIAGILAPAPEQNETSKTDLVRDQLKSHPNGIRPAQVWLALKNQIPQRSYVYAVLGRLKAREEVAVRRGKYFYRVPPAKPETEKEGRIMTIQ